MVHSPRNAILSTLASGRQMTLFGVITTCLSLDGAITQKQVQEEIIALLTDGLVRDEYEQRELHLSLTVAGKKAATARR